MSYEQWVARGKMRKDFKLGPHPLQWVLKSKAATVLSGFCQRLVQLLKVVGCTVFRLCACTASPSPESYAYSHYIHFIDRHKMQIGGTTFDCNHYWLSQETTQFRRFQASSFPNFIELICEITAVARTQPCKVDSISTLDTGKELPPPTFSEGRYIRVLILWCERRIENKS